MSALDSGCSSHASLDRDLPLSRRMRLIPGKEHDFTHRFPLAAADITALPLTRAGRGRPPM